VAAGTERGSAGEDGVGRLILVRHGESEGNQVRRFSVTSDIGLTELGIEQARAAGRRIAERFRPAALVASPFRRAQLTADLIAGEIGHRSAIRTEKDLRERSIGDLAGEPYDAMRRHPTFDPERFWEWRPPGGESLVDVAARAGRVLARLAADHPDDDVVVVSHGGVMLALCAHVEGGWYRPRVASNCELLVVAHDAGGGCGSRRSRRVRRAVLLEVRAAGPAATVAMAMAMRVGDEVPSVATSLLPLTRCRRS
jgi:probable phosphoglycerate mutase